MYLDKNVKMLNQEFERYQRILGVKQKKPCIEELYKIVKAHMFKIPFENISKLYYLNKFDFKDTPTLTQFLDGIEYYNFGGTCYSNNFHLYQLLKFLRYNVKLCGADMNQPDVHIVNLVKIDNREFLVDVGYAAPFIEPLPRDLISDYSISLGADEYILSPLDANRRSKLTLKRNGLTIHGYLINPKSRFIDEFKPIIVNSFRSKATFRNCVLLVRFGNNYSQVIHNKHYIESRGKKVLIKSIKTNEKLIEMIEEIFNIPSAILRTALEGLSMTQNAWN